MESDESESESSSNDENFEDAVDNLGSLPDILLNSSKATLCQAKRPIDASQGDFDTVRSLQLNTPHVIYANLPSSFLNTPSVAKV